jgi:hypothetical protein
LNPKNLIAHLELTVVDPTGIKLWNISSGLFNQGELKDESQKKN